MPASGSIAWYMFGVEQAFVKLGADQPPRR